MGGAAGRARGGGHPAAGSERPARQAGPRAQDGCRGQRVAGAGLPVRAGAAESCSSEAVPRAAGAGPAPAAGGRGSGAVPQPGAQAGRPRGPAGGRRALRHLRQERAAHPRRPCRRAASWPGPRPMSRASGPVRRAFCPLSCTRMPGRHSRIFSTSTTGRRARLRTASAPSTANSPRIMFQKFCKMLSLKFGHGKSIGFGINHPLHRKGRHHDRDA